MNTETIAVNPKSCGDNILASIAAMINWKTAPEYFSIAMYESPDKNCFLNEVFFKSSIFVIK